MTRRLLGLLLGMFLIQPANAFFFYDHEKSKAQENERRCMAEEKVKATYIRIAESYRKCPYKMAGWLKS